MKKRVKSLDQYELLHLLSDVVSLSLLRVVLEFYICV